VHPINERVVDRLEEVARPPLLDRSRGEADPRVLFASVPGVGRVLAGRVHDELGLETLADFEAAAHDGRLATLGGFGEKRLARIRASLASRLGRISPSSTGDVPTVCELLDVDREYRDKATAGELPRIAPRRFNPTREAWLPVLHTRRGTRRYTALFSNTARAHHAGKTQDWVVLYSDDGSGEDRHTVLTAAFGPLRGRRVVAGRDEECAALYQVPHVPASTRRVGPRQWTARVRDQAS